jgi:cytochrome b involved in lipid metabolism
MMRWLFLLGTSLFWIAVLVLWAAARWLPPVVERPPVAAESRLTINEVARHASPEDCWMAIDRGVYELTRYLPEHPSKSGIVEPWCGQEATEAYRTKMKGRPHSAEADNLLTQYRIGVLE